MKPLREFLAQDFLWKDGTITTTIVDALHEDTSQKEYFKVREISPALDKAYLDMEWAAEHYSKYLEQNGIINTALHKALKDLRKARGE